LSNHGRCQPLTDEVPDHRQYAGASGADHLPRPGDCEGAKYGDDEHQLVSQVALTPVANVVDTNYTVVAKVPWEHLPAAKPAMGGVHAWLRRRAQDYLRSR
jgi:hypothetical protein